MFEDTFSHDAAHVIISVCAFGLELTSLSTIFPSYHDNVWLQQYFYLDVSNFIHKHCLVNDDYSKTLELTL